MNRFITFLIAPVFAFCLASCDVVEPITGGEQVQVTYGKINWDPLKETAAGAPTIHLVPTLDENMKLVLEREAELADKIFGVTRKQYEDTSARIEELKTNLPAPITQTLSLPGHSREAEYTTNAQLINRFQGDMEAFKLETLGPQLETLVDNMMKAAELQQKELERINSRTALQARVDLIWLRELAKILDQDWPKVKDKAVAITKALQERRAAQAAWKEFSELQLPPLKEKIELLKVAEGQTDGNGIFQVTGVGEPIAEFKIGDVSIFFNPQVKSKAMTWNSVDLKSVEVDTSTGEAKPVY